MLKEYSDQEKAEQKASFISDVMFRFPSNIEIYKWLREQKYQREQGEQEYIMLYEIDMPKILKEFTEHLLNEV